MNSLRWYISMISQTLKVELHRHQLGKVEWRRWGAPRYVPGSKRYLTFAAAPCANEMRVRRGTRFVCVYIWSVFYRVFHNLYPCRRMLNPVAADTLTSLFLNLHISLHELECQKTRMSSSEGFGAAVRSVRKSGEFPRLWHKLRRVLLRFLLPPSPQGSNVPTFFASTNMSQQPPPQTMPPMIPDSQDMSGNSYYPPESDLTGGLPINLDSLRDGPPGSKPFYPYSTLIRYVSPVSILTVMWLHNSLSSFCHWPPFSLHISYAIKGSPNQKLLLEDIYYAIESRVCYNLQFLRILIYQLSGFAPVPLLQNCP